MNILLIRHGEAEPHTSENFSVEKNQSDPVLTYRGCDQAELLGRRLAGEGLQAVYSSDLLRAWQTAGAVARNSGLPVIIREGVREINMGRLNHISWEELKAEDPAFYDQWQRHDSDMRYPGGGGETGGEAAARVMEVIREITESGLEKVAVVTHGGIIRILFCAALGIGQEKRFLFGGPENTSVSVLGYDVGERRYSIESMNDHSHLSKSP